MPNEELTLGVGLEGKDKVKGGLNEIADAQNKVTGQTGAASSATKEAADAQDNLNASEGDYIALLAGISPALGRIADLFIKGSKVASEFALSQTDLAGAAKKASAAIKGNAAALKLLGAGGLVLAAIFAITSALKKMREEAEAVAKETREIVDAQTELKNQAADNQQSIESIRDASGQAPFDADQARAAGKTFGRVRDKFDDGFLTDDAIKRVIASVGGASDTAGGGSRSIEEIARIAFLQQSGKLDLSKAGGATGDARIENALNRHSDTIEAAFGREGVQQNEAIKRAVAESRSVGGSTTDLEELIKKFTGGTGTDPRTVALIVQAMEDVFDKQGRQAGFGISSTESREGFFRRINESLLTEALKELREDGDLAIGEGDLNAETIRIARQSLQQLTAMKERLDREPQGATTIINDNRGANMMGESAASQRSRVVNGENKRDRSGL